MATRRPSASISVWRYIDTETFLIGAAHYPEHVDESYWERDAERMAAAGFNTVRMGEFAWHILEPREGQFDFELFDRNIALLGARGIKTIMCTPTATPPRWLTISYPDVLRVDGNGRRASHGSRQHADTTSPVYRLHSQRITRALAEHYRNNPHVVGWQTDNELNTSESRSYSEATRREFQKFLEEKYGTVNALNHAWGGDFWATALQNFNQVVLPFDYNPVFPSPGQIQDYHRFLAFATARFQHDQVEILRETNPQWFIFHNLGRLEDIDFRGQFSKDLDFAGYDIYPLLYDELQRNGGAAYAQALHLDICRGFSGNFIVPEQQSGFGSQPGFSTLTPEPGEMRRMAFSSVARGADGLMFFRWRPAHFGAEIYWMGIIDHDNVPRRRYEEARQFAGEVNSIKNEILGTSVRMDVGIAGGDFDNQEAHRTYPMGVPSPHDDAILLHRFCYNQGIACGFIHLDDDLSRLKVLYIPHWVMWKNEWTKRIRAFAEMGGTVILSARTGSRDEHNHVIREAAPGQSLAELTGVTIEEFGPLAAPNADGLLSSSARYSAVTGRPRYPAESARRRYTLKIGNHECTAAHMYELLSPEDDVETVGQWSNRFLSGRPALTSRKVGRGRVLYLATYLTEDLVDVLINDVIAKAGVSPLIAELPPGVEVSVRDAADRHLLFVLNTLDEEANVRDVPNGTVLLCDGTLTETTLSLPGYGCAIMRLAARST